MGFNTLTALFYFYFILQLHLEIRKFSFKNMRRRDRGAEERGEKQEKKEEIEQVRLDLFSCFFGLT